MLKIIQGKNTCSNAVKRNIESLTSVFSRFNEYSEESKAAFLNKNYAAGIVAIASNLDSMFKSHEGMKQFEALSRLLRASNKYDNFDPRYLSEFKAKPRISWTLAQE